MSLDTPASGIVRFWQANLSLWFQWNVHKALVIFSDNQCHFLFKSNPFICLPVSAGSPLEGVRGLDTVGPEDGEIETRGLKGGPGCWLPGVTLRAGPEKVACLWYWKPAHALPGWSQSLFGKTLQISTSRDSDGDFIWFQVLLVAFSRKLKANYM